MITILFKKKPTKNNGLYHISDIYFKTYLFFRILYKRLFNRDIRLCWKSLFQANTVTTTDKTTDYKEANNYQDLNPNTNSNYQKLNFDTNYHERKLPYGEENQYQNTTL